MVNRVSRKEVKKKFSKSNFRLPQTATVLAQQYNVKTKSWWSRWRWQVLLLGILAIVFICTYSGIFKIRNVIVEGVPSPSTEATIRGLLDDILSHRRLFILPQNNLAIFSSAAAKKALDDELGLDQVDFDKHWPNVLRVNIKEDIVVGVVKINDRYYTVDKRGVVINQLIDLTLEPNATLIQSPDISTAIAGEQLISTDLAVFLKTLSESWREVVDLPKIANLEYISAELPKVIVTTSDGWQVYVSSREPVSDQLESLQAILKETLMDQLPALLYIYVRFVSKIYYKLNES